MSVMCGSLHLSSSPGLGPTTSFRTNHHVALRVQTHLHGAVAALKIKSDYHSASGGEKKYGIWCSCKTVSKADSCFAHNEANPGITIIKFLQKKQ